MKITAIETIHNKNFSNIVQVKIYTDEGLTGLGETFRNPNAIISYIHESCTPYLLGKDLLRINEHADNLSNWIVTDIYWFQKYNCTFILFLLLFVASSKASLADLKSNL